MQVINKHTAAIDNIPKGAVGEVDPSNPGIKALLDAGHLVPVDGSALASPLDGPIDRALAERFEAEWRDREASLSRYHAQELAQSVALRDKRIADLEAEVVELRAQLAKKPSRAKADDKPEG